MVRWLTFMDFQVQGEYLYFVPLGQSGGEGSGGACCRPCCCISASLHLAMNALWIWELGRRIEYRHGGLVLLGWCSVTACCPISAQFWFGGPSLFGGLSGVLYGLLGYCWIFSCWARRRFYQLPPGVLAMMLIWLLVCLSRGDLRYPGPGAIANAAHVGGLVAGCWPLACSAVRWRVCAGKLGALFGFPLWVRDVVLCRNDREHHP